MQISEHVHALRIPFKVPLSPTSSLERFVYCYTIYGDKVCLVDTGVAGSESMIFDHLRGVGHDPSEIRTIVQTHSHPDHIGSTKAIKGVPTVMWRSITRREGGWRTSTRSSQNAQCQGSMVWWEVRSPVDRALNDGDHLELGDGLTLEVIHTPGHSSGSISLFLREEGVLITGDAVPLVGEMPVYEDATASMRSVERLLGIDGVKVLLGSWDAPRYGNEVRRVLSDALGYLEDIDRKVKEIAERDQSISSTRTLQKGPG